MLFRSSTRNAALQRLFADPHFNRICDMNIDIEDFTKFDPIPQAMLRMMEQARSLGFFADEENPEKPTQALADGDRTPPGSTSESSAQAAIADRQQADSQQRAALQQERSVPDSTATPVHDRLESTLPEQSLEQSTVDKREG